MQQNIRSCASDSQPKVGALCPFDGFSGRFVATLKRSSVQC